MIDRIEKLLLDAGVPRRQIRNELAKTCGISVQAVGDWFNGNTKNILNIHLASIVDRWGESIDYLVTGKRPLNVQEPPAGYSAKRVPLISWVTAGTWEEPVDNYAVGDAEEWLPCPPGCNDASTFALLVTGESMDDGTPQGYRDGEIIFVDGSQLEPQHNSDVVVRNGGGKVTFKRLINSNGEWLLKPLNKDWPDKIIPLDEGSKIIGRVMFSGMKR